MSHGIAQMRVVISETVGGLESEHGRFLNDFLKNEGALSTLK